MDDIMRWLREQIARDRAEAEKGVSDTAPSAVLAQCEAHTAILDEHAPRREHTVDGDLVCSTCVYTGWDEDPGGNRSRYRDHHDWPCQTVLAVALAYRHRPGFRNEWLPESHRGTLAPPG